MSRDTSAPVGCPSCRSSEVVNVRLALGEGTSVKFGFCTQCEWRGWDREGLKVPLSSILGLLASR